MNNIFDITSYNLPEFSAKTEYKYGYYSEQDEEVDNFVENQDNDINISFDRKNYSSIKIEIEFKQNEFERLKDQKYLNLNRNISRNIKEFLNSLQGKNLLISATRNSITDIEYFNQQNSFEDKINSYIVKTEKKSQEKILNAYNIVNQSRYNNLLDNNFKQYSVSNQYIQDVFTNKSKNNFSNEENLFRFFKSLDQNEISDKISLDLLANSLNIENNLEVFIKPIENNSLSIAERARIRSNAYDQSVLFEKLKYFHNDPIEEENNNENFSKNGSVFVGFLIKKHIKRRDGTLILNSSAGFVYQNIENIQKNITFFDINTSYGNFYSYEIIPVFYLSLNSYEGFIERNHYLICQNSFFCNFIKSVEYDQPKPPSALRAKYLFNSKKVLLEWDFPPNPAGDVIGYQVYRRRSLEEPFQLIKVFMKKDPSRFRNFNMFSDIVSSSLIDVSKSGKEIVDYFEDNIDNINELYIYSVCSVDAHGMVSNYSNQIAVRYSIVHNKLIIDNVSLSGAPRQYPNLYIQRKSMLFENDNLLFNFTPFFKNKEKIKLYFTPDCNEIALSTNEKLKISDFSNSNYHLNLVRLTDLQTKNIVFNFKTN